MGIVVAGVSTLLGFWTAGIDHAILCNVIVVTDGVETTALWQDSKASTGKSWLIRGHCNVPRSNRFFFDSSLDSMDFKGLMFSFAHGSHRSHGFLLLRSFFL